jgi:hypothetical protein
VPALLLAPTFAMALAAGLVWLIGSLQHGAASGFPLFDPSKRPKPHKHWRLGLFRSVRRIGLRTDRKFKKSPWLLSLVAWTDR